MKVNESAAKIVKEMIEKSNELGIESLRLKNGATILDCGVKSLGGFEAGRLYSVVCLGGLAKVWISEEAYASLELPTISIETNNPRLACIETQKVGWKVKVGDFFGMGSGPARLLLKASKQEYKENSKVGVLAIESAKIPDERVAMDVALKCGIETRDLDLLVTRTASIVGSIQVSSRMVETALYKMDHLGMDVKVRRASGSAPIAPVIGDDKRMMGVENDMIIYGSTVHLDVEGEMEVEAIPSNSSPDYGEPFSEVFKKAGYDFYKIDPAIFAPAMVTVKNLVTGEVKNAGGINNQMIEKTLVPSG
jgi:methenyltetrahydromethanopterin cyclohydrolase